MNITYNWLEIVNLNKFYYHNSWYQIYYLEDTFNFNSKSICLTTKKEYKFLKQCLVENNKGEKYIIQCYIVNFLQNNKKYILIKKMKLISYQNKIIFSGNLIKKELEYKYYQLWNTQQFDIFYKNFIKLLEQYKIDHNYDKNDILNIYHFCLPIKEIDFDKNLLFPYFSNHNIMLLEKESEFLFQNIQFLNKDEIINIKNTKKNNPDILTYFTKLKYKIYIRKYKQNKLNTVIGSGKKNKQYDENKIINQNPTFKKDMRNLMINLALNRNIDKYLNKYQNITSINSPLILEEVDKKQINQNKYEDLLFDLFYQKKIMNKKDEKLYLDNYQLNNEKSKEILKKMLKEYFLYETYDNFIYDYLVPYNKYILLGKNDLNHNIFNRERIKDIYFWFRYKLIFHLLQPIFN